MILPELILLVVMICVGFFVFGMLVGAKRERRYYAKLLEQEQRYSEKCFVEWMECETQWRNYAMKLTAKVKEESGP